MQVNADHDDGWYDGAVSAGMNNNMNLGSCSDGNCGGSAPTPRPVTYIYGCMDRSAANYNYRATRDDGSCLRPVYGCTDRDATNFDFRATQDDGSCIR
jgi:hypothetical protein